MSIELNKYRKNIRKNKEEYQEEIKDSKFKLSDEIKRLEFEIDKSDISLSVQIVAIALTFFSETIYSFLKDLITLNTKDSPDSYNTTIKWAGIISIIYMLVALIGLLILIKKDKKKKKSMFYCLEALKELKNEIE